MKLPYTQSVMFGLVVLGIPAIAIAYLLYRLALPRPIPGIPCHATSAKRVLGDLPELIRWQKSTSEVFTFMAAQFTELNSPILQLFLKPFGRPAVFLADFREGQDILMRRTKEFDRSNFVGDMFIGILPHHQLSMPTNDASKAQRRLLSDTMSPEFLHHVGLSTSTSSLN